MMQQFIAVLFITVQNYGSSQTLNTWIINGLRLLLLLSHFSHVRLCVTHRRQPTRLLCPWDSPGKNTGVGCHFLLQCMKVRSESEVSQLCPTLSNSMDCSLPGSSIQGITIAFSGRCSEDSSKPCVHQDPGTPQRLSQNCVCMSPVKVQVSSGLPQGNRH